MTLNWRDDYAPHTVSRGPVSPHTMNGDRCRRRWKLLTFENGTRLFHCVGCDVGIHESAKGMFGGLMNALKKERKQ